MKGALFVARKPLFVSSNNFLTRIKRERKTKTAGYSGTLDPFAVGTLLIGLDGASKLFNYLSLEPKRYLAVLWLGASSETLDIEGIERVDEIEAFNPAVVQNAVERLTNVSKIIPPKFSAKRISGKRAYELARENKEVNLKECDITVFEAKLILYSHPFVTFEVAVSKGTYVRTLGQMVAEKLGVNGSLSYLERLSEGAFVYENQKILNVRECLNIPLNRYKKDKSDIIHGKKVNVSDFEITEDGVYYLQREGALSIVEIRDSKVIYKLNNIEV